jgi:drug/metabolite transporter (DMT)-like permease
VVAALGAAGISGVAVFLNSYAVRAVGDPTVYTTAKNGVAALLLLAAAAVAPPPAPRPASPAHRRRWWALGAVAVVGGSVPFVLFFEGLARATSGAVQAQFLHKTLVVWVVLLAVPLLGERLGGVQVAAVALLVGGQVVLAGGLGAVGRLRPGPGEALILGATLLWAVEVVLARRLLRAVPARTVALARMVPGSALLVGWLAVSGRLGALAGLDAEGWAWVLLTGVVLAGYVTAWLSALERAPAVLVTSLLVAAVPVTALMQAAASGGPAAPATGLVAVVAGCGLVLLAAGRARAPAG